MDYLRKLGSLTSTLTFPYHIGDYITSIYELFDGWTLQAGFDKKSNEKVLIHRYNLKQASIDNITIARKNVTKCKTLHHPFILKFKYSHEDGDNITLVTEYGVPLEYYLKRCTNDESWRQTIDYGILCLLEGLGFLHNQAKLQHNKLVLNSIFVTQVLEWKIVGFGYSTNIGDPNSVDNFNRYINGCPYVVNIPPNIKFVENVDSWALACVIYVVYNWNDKDMHLNMSTLKSTSKIPNVLSNVYKKLLSCDRINMVQIIEEQRISPGIFSTSSIHFRSKLQNLYLLNDQELYEFFISYKPELKKVSPEIGMFKLFPILNNFYNYGKLLHIVQPTIIYMITNFLNKTTIDNNQYKDVNHTQLKETIFKLWTSTDRVTRLQLLDNVEPMLKYLDDKDNVGKQIVMHYTKGFTDSCQEMRLKSAKCIGIFIKNLPSKELTNKFIPFIAKVIEESHNKYLINTLLENIQKEWNELPSESVKCIITAVINKLRSLIKRPTYLIHDINKFLMEIHELLPLKLVVTIVIPAMCQLLLCSNKCVREDAAKLCNIFITCALEQSQQSAINDNIYYDVCVANTQSNNISNVDQLFMLESKPIAISNNNHHSGASNTNIPNVSSNLDLYPQNSKNVELLAQEHKNQLVEESNLMDDLNGWNWDDSFNDITNIDSTTKSRADDILTTTENIQSDDVWEDW